jgi:hypothetical protein
MGRTQLQGEQVGDNEIQEVDLDLGLGANQVKAASLPVDTSDFDNNLSGADTDVQKALDTLDDLDIVTYAEESIISSFFDDFIFGTNESGEVGIFGWVVYSIGGAPTVSDIPPAGRLGVKRVSTARAKNKGGTLSTSYVGVFRQHAAMRFALSVKIPDITNITLRFGIHDQTVDDAQPDDGIYYEFDTTLGDTTWKAVTASNGVRTKSNTGVTVSAGTWYRLEMLVNDTNTGVTFYVDKVEKVTNTTNLPVADGREFGPALAMITRTNAIKYFDVDYYLVKTPLLDR